MDLINIIKHVVLIDLTYHLQFDFLHTSREYGPWYSHFEELGAYESCDEYTEQESCPICLVKYKNNHSISILRCGHKFHRSCIDDYECIKWKDTDKSSPYHYPYSICPLCKQKYDVWYDKYQFNANNQRHFLEREISIPGEKLMNKYVWKQVYNDYKSHFFDIRENKRHYLYCR